MTDSVAMPIRISREIRRVLRDRVRRSSTSFGVLATCVLGTALASALSARNARIIDDKRLDEVVTDVDDAIRSRLETYFGALRGARGLFVARGDPGPDEFRAFVNAAEMTGARYPGVQGIGWAELVQEEQIAKHVQKIRTAGVPNYDVWPRRGRELAPVIYLEPRDWRNDRAIGFDMLSEPTRRDAMRRARMSGEAVMSGRVILVQEIDRDVQPGFLVYLPVYRDGAKIDTPEAREGALRGWVYSPFRAGDFVRAVLAHDTNKHLVDVEVWDGPPIETNLLFRDVSPETPRLQRYSSILAAGRTWTVRFGTRPDFERDSRRLLPFWVAVSGGIMSVLLFFLSEEQTRRRLAAEARFARSTLIAGVGKDVALSLDPEPALRTVAARVTSSFADGCTIHVDREDGTRTTAFAGVREGPQSLELPLVARAERIGSIRYVRNADARPFERDDQAVAEELARVVSGALENARSYATARDAVRVRDDFLSIASHELKTPLTALRLQMQMLSRTLSRDARPKEIIDRAERQVGRLTRLVESLLDLSRIANDRLELDREELDLFEVLREVVGRVSVMAAAQGSTIDIRGDEPIIGRWDRLRLDQVITNLVSNAIKYGGGKPIEVEARGERTDAVIIVRDHGIGIAREDVERIFARFERAVSSRHYGGLGLGLYITRQIVEAHGGNIAVSSIPGEGSTFTVRLPRQA